LLDAAETAFTVKELDAVAVVCNDTPDFAYLFSKLRKQNIEVYGTENLSEENKRFVDRILNFRLCGSKLEGN